MRKFFAICMALNRLHYIKKRGLGKAILCKMLAFWPLFCLFLFGLYRFLRESMHTILNNLLHFAFVFVHRKCKFRVEIVLC